MKEEKINIVPYPIENRVGHERRFLCPECQDSRLPIDAKTECDTCGAHLEIYVKTVAPSINHE